MPSSIPYDHPSLVLGHIASPGLLDLLKQINGLQTKITAAQGKITSYVMMKRSLAMTINELTDMNVDVTNLKAKITGLDASITAAASDYMSTCIQCQTEIQQLREQISALDLDDGMESPVDFTQSRILRLPLSAESLTLDVQYFSFGSSNDDQTIASVEKYIKESTADLGSKSADLAKMATAQINQQRQNHNLAGTLIITASCTHPNVAIIEPFIVDVEKAIAIWNSLYPSEQDRIKTNDPSTIKALLNEETQSASEKCLTVLSGATYGSSFVGMVHILQTDMASIGPMNAIAAQLQEKLKLGGWLENATGGFGVDPSVVDDVRKILSTQSISSHVSLIVMGATPSLASNQLKLSVSKFLQPDPEKMNAYLTALASSSSHAGEATVESDADQAQTGKRLLSLQNANTQSILQGLANVDHGANKVLDINSMMVAFENYLQAIKDKDESIGVPINFYVKKITKAQFAKWWVDQYYPEAEKGANASETK